MITVGLCKEIFYISYVTNKEVMCDLSIFPKKTTDNQNGFNILLKVSPDSSLQIFYKTQLIWKEKIEDPAIGFSIESVDTIFKIIDCINKNDQLWITKYPFPLK